MRSTLCALAALTLLAACGSNGGGNAGAPAKPVAAVTAPAGQDWTQTVVKTAEGGYRMGNPDAAIKLIEYGSRTCPTCGAFGQTGMEPLERGYVASGKVSYEFRDFAVHGPMDFGPSILGRCVGEAAFFPVLEQMYKDQPTLLAKEEGMQRDDALAARLQNATPLQTATIFADYFGYVDWMKQHGLAEQQARACLADPKALQAVIDLTNKGNTDGVTGTPMFFLNGDKLDGTLSWAQLEPQLKHAGA